MRLHRKTYAQRFTEAYGAGAEAGLRTSALGQYMPPIPPSRWQRVRRWVVNLVTLR